MRSQGVVERLARVLATVRPAVDDQPPGSECGRQRVAHGGDRRASHRPFAGGEVVPSARDDERRAISLRQLVERDLGLPRRTLGHRRRGCPGCPGRDSRALGHVETAAVTERLEKPQPELRRRQPGGGVDALEVRDQLLDGGVASRNGEGGGLGHGQGAYRLRSARGGEERHDRAIGVPHEMGALPQQRGDVVRVGVEVGRTVRRAPAITTAVGQDKRVRIREGPLLAKPELSPGQAAVDADDTLAVAPHGDVEIARAPREARGHRPAHATFSITSATP
jgi:hypothetical protein